MRLTNTPGQQMIHSIKQMRTRAIGCVYSVSCIITIHTNGVYVYIKCRCALPTPKKWQTKMPQPWHGWITQFWVCLYIYLCAYHIKYTFIRIMERMKKKSISAKRENLLTLSAPAVHIVCHYSFKLLTKTIFLCHWVCRKNGFPYP